MYITNVSNVKFIFNEKLGKSMILEFFSDRIMDNSTEERLLSPEELNSSDLKRRVWNESKKLWVIAFPGVVARVSSFGMIVVTQLFMGHISELDLAAFGLQQSILLRFVDGILVRPPLNILLLWCKKIDLPFNWCFVREKSRNPYLIILM